MIPKIAMHMMVNALKLFIKEELLASLYREAGRVVLMEENAAETQRRQETLSMFASALLLSVTLNAR